MKDEKANNGDIGCFVFILFLVILVLWDTFTARLDSLGKRIDALESGRAVETKR